MKYCLVNGKEQPHIDVQNRGLAYGDGLFTTAKILHGQVQYLNAHVDRLISGCKQLGISSPSKKVLVKQMSQVANQYDLAVLKVIIIAQSGGRGYARAVSNGYDLVIMVHDFPEHYDQQALSGIKLGISSQKIGINPMLKGLKHLNRLEQVLLRQELSLQPVDELVVANINDEIIEAISANLFCYLDGQWYTPDVSQSGVNGIMRQAVLNQYPETKVASLSLSQLKQSQAIFICNSVMGVMPIAEFNNNPLSIEQALAVRQVMLKE